jgi:hypothetical protein
MIIKTNYTYCTLFIALAAITFTACTKDGNPNNLPDVDVSDFTGKIDGYSSSDEIYPANLVAYWNFDGTKNEKLNGTVPTSSLNDAFVDGGVKGQALSLNAGYVYYANQFNSFKTDALKSFTVSEWVQILNNGSKKTMTFQLARPGVFNGNINFTLETNTRPATDVNNITVHPTFTATNGGTQDNLNANTSAGDIFKSPTIGLDKWTHLVITYDGVANNLQIWGDGIKIGATAYQNRGTNFFKSWEPSEVIIGSNYNSIPGHTVNTDVTFAPMTGRIDEIRVFNICLPDAHIKTLYKLGVAHQ